MSYLVDTSVAVKWFVETERFFEEALAFLERHQRELQAPDVLLIEVANVARKKYSQGEISDQQAREILPAVRDYIPEFHPAQEFLDRAFEIALVLDHSIYDCLYLACAESTQGILVTDDRKLRRKVVGTEFAALVQLLVDVQ